MEEAERERLEQLLEAVTLARNADQVRAEVAELRALAEQAATWKKWLRGQAGAAQGPAPAGRVLR